MTTYANVNTKTKKALNDRIKAGDKIGVRNLTPMGDEPVKGDTTIPICGPWYPAPHSWYGEAVLKDGILVKVK